MKAASADRVSRRRLAKVGTLSLAILGCGLLAMQAAGAASSSPRSAAIAAATASTTRPVSPMFGAPFHQTRAISRINLINGHDVVVDRRTVSLSVDVTSNLIDRQVIKVTWRGAHPTGGIHLDANDGPNAQFDEYPMVLLECHGRPSSSAPLAQQIQPQDCWTSTPSERFYSASPDQPFPPWRLDRYATAAGQRNLTENQPTPLPASCGLFPGPHYWLNYLTPSGKSYPIGPGGCAGMPNEMSLLGGLGILPSNETFAATQLNGRGSASFDVWTNELNPDLGCSQKVPCALVAVPIIGISCDPAAASMPTADQPTPAQEPAAAATCEQTGNWLPGSIDSANNNTGALTVSGQLWWAASNWRNRFVVPLHFAPPANICSLVSRNNRFLQIYGSELMDQAAGQWQPHFCLNKKLYTLEYVATPEPEAATQLAAGTLDAALVSDQPSTGFGRPVIYAPVAATGFAISFVIDNLHGLPVSTLRLDPRLLAKLLTESYPAVNDIATKDPEILHPCPGVPVPGSNLCTNPYNITLDPEFRALNPGITKGVGASAAASVLLGLSTSSDVMYALTSYINADPAARSWLNGTPDPWGMTVNSAYKGIALPVQNWPLLSTFEPAAWKTGGGGPGPCYALNPSPALPLIASPIPDLFDLAENIQFYVAQSELQCVGNPDVPRDYHLAPLGPQTVGFRFMIGVTTLADARRYQLGTASLLTHSKPGIRARFTSPAGMTFVAPTDTALRSATSLLVPDTTHDLWNFPYRLLHNNNAKVAHAYPGTMLVYADIPTQGLKLGEAAEYASFLRFAASRGQVPGGGIGQLASGYLPMTAANHLSAQARYTLAGAAAVAAQKGAIPPLSSSISPSPSPSPSSGPGSGGGSSGTPSPGSSGGGSPSPGTGTSGPGGRIALTPAANFGIIGYVLPALVGLALLAGLAAAVYSRVTRFRPVRAASAGGVLGWLGRLRKWI